MYYDDPTQPVEYVRAQPPRKKGCLRGCFSRLLLITVLGVALVVFTGVVIAGTLIYSSLSRDIEEGITALDGAYDRELFETTRIYDRHGELLWEFFGEGKRTRISLDQMPQHLIDATIAVEDDTFYDNEGFDFLALVAALVANFRNPDDRPVGGSTITQQIVRHIAFDYEERTSVSYNRKSKEIILAYIMNQKFSKDEILEMYMNEIYYGNLAYGVEAAAQTYFGKSASDLSLAEATLLAGLPQSPVKLDPFVNLDQAKERQWIILNLMAQDGKLEDSLLEPTYLVPLDFAEQSVSLKAPHFAVYVRQQLEAQFGTEEVANGGLQVTTSLDLQYQRLAELLAQRHVSELATAHNLHNASLVAMKPNTGEILAMLGSVDYQDDTIDGRVNVALSLQQPGSAIKPLVYAAALVPASGDGSPTWTAADVLWDVPVEYPQFDGSTYIPVNYDERYHGPVRLRDALANSYNVPAILVLQDIGLPRFFDFARQIGITTFDGDVSQYGLSASLGGAEVTPLDLTTAYAVLANKGNHVTPTSILRVVKNDGTVLFESEPTQPQTVLDPRVAFLMSDILDDDAARMPAMGRNNPLALPFPAAAKTGTSNDFRDNWTVGYTPGLVVSVWAGNTDNSPMVNVSGLTGAAPLWNAFMQAVYSDYDLVESLNTNGTSPPTEFTPTATGLEQRRICDLRSVVGWTETCQLAGSEWFLQTNESATPTPSLEVPLGEEMVVWEKLDPAVWQMPAYYLQPNLQVEETTPLKEGDLPSQSFCHFKRGQRLTDLPPDLITQVFLQPPRNAESLEGAYTWAFEHGVMILPATPCQEAELYAILTTRTPTTGIWRITSPQSGDEVSGVIPIYGIASFNPSEVQFYKVEIDLSTEQWVTLGTTHPESVVNGVLEYLHADALPAGEYHIRLVGVQWDGNYAGNPPTIPITIVPPAQ